MHQSFDYVELKWSEVVISMESFKSLSGLKEVLPYSFAAVKVLRC